MYRYKLFDFFKKFLLKVILSFAFRKFTDIIAKVIVHKISGIMGFWVT